MKESVPVRKSTRSKNIDYSKPGAYFVTICTRNRKDMLSRIENDCMHCCNEVESRALEAGAASYSPTIDKGFSANFPKLFLTEIGKIAERQLLAACERFSNVRIDEYVIMPNHIHIIIFIDGHEEGFVHGLNDVIRVFKSTASRECKAKYQIDGLFQRSYYDHLIKDKADYTKIVRYIRENPKTWFYDRYYRKYYQT